ncbi:phage/plasmid primase, P4 family [Roseovarius sp. C7]|uniref:DNA primase family protein n=1 Tax=Roseovarius sp. C7 TaxID=3398643 RepID=UPI0039F4F372
MQRKNTALARSDQVSMLHEGLGKVLTLTRFPDWHGYSKSVLKVSLPELVSLIAETTEAEKTKLPMLSGLTWGTLRTKNKSLKHEANARAVHAIFVDYDAGEITPEEAVEHLKASGLIALLYTSPRHGMRGLGNRWRLVMPLNEPANPDAYAGLVARVNGIFDGALADKFFRLSQAYFFGSVRGGSPVQTFLVDGARYIDEAEDLEEDALGPSKPPSIMLSAVPQAAVDQSNVPEAISRAMNGLKYAKARVLDAANKGHSRTDEILRQAVHLGGYVACNVLTEELVRQVLTEAADAVGYDYPRRELDRHITSGLKLGIARPLPWHDPADDLPDLATKVREGANKISDEELAAIADELGLPIHVVFPDRFEPLVALSEARERADARAPFGDVWNGAQHANRLRGERLYVSALGQWLEWTGQRWAAMTPEQMAADAKETSAAIYVGTADMFRDDSSGENQALMAKAAKLHGNADALGRMEKMARSEPGMHVASPAEFDLDPYALTCLNGIVDLSTGRLRSARPEDRVSKLAGCEFDPDAKCPMFEAFLETIMPDPEIRAFVQRAVGYTLTGLVDEEVFFLAYGTGQNGKSVFANIIAAVMGEYTVSLGAALVTLRKHENEAERQMAQLPGRRLALVNETAQGEVFDSARVKAIASREKLAARFLKQEVFNFMPTHKLWVRTNHLPGSLDPGDGFWRRCTPIPFTVRIPDDKKIGDLDRKIIASELPGVLAWAVRGAVEWASRGGLRVPQAISAIVAEYRDDTDILGEWFAERVERDPDATVTVAAAYTDYAEHCKAGGMSPGSKPSFSRAMTDRGQKRAPGTGTRRFVGFRLRASFDAGSTSKRDEPEDDALI